MFVTIINDCNDDNVMARQSTRASSFFQCAVSTVGIGSYKDLEAAGNLVDMLDSADGEVGIILMNSAPRHGRGKKWPNGTPFGYFYYGETLVVSTVDGYPLSLAKKFGLIEKFYLTDIPTVVDHFITKGELKSDLRDRIALSQFRSFDYMPRLAKWLHEGKDVPNEEYPLENIPEVPKAVWWVDNFGNCKTTMLEEEVGFEHGKKITTSVGELTCYTHLRDVPNDEAGLIIGSSGFGDKRFLEVVVQGKSAAAKYDLTSGSVLID